MRDERLDKILKFDPLDFAERLTGDDSKDPEGPGFALGFAMFMHHNEKKQRELIAADDTKMGDCLIRYARIIEAAGFEKVFEERFDGNQEGKHDTYFVYARRDGLILDFDTYWQWHDTIDTSINSGKLWYNWLPNDPEGSHYGVTSSGGFREYAGEPYRLWVGDHDCREALLHNIAGLTDNGSFLSRWETRPSAFWLTHYMDNKAGGEDFRERIAHYERLTEARLSAMPSWVCEMVTPAKGIEAGTAETRNEVRSEGREPGPSGFAQTSSPDSRRDG